MCKILKKINLIVGARPNFIKAFPVYRALERTNNFVLRLINTGQHYDENMASIFFKQLKMKEPDLNLEIGSGLHGEQTGKILTEIEKVFIDEKPDLVMVFGDVNSTLASALAASKLCIPIAHVEAGLRSFDHTMPEEINRVITDQISNLLFTTSREAETNLVREGKRSNQIFFIGNTMIDSLLQFKPHFDATDILNKFDLKKGEYIIVTMHRPSNVDSLDNLISIIEALNKVSDLFPCIWPVHPRIRETISKMKINIGEKLLLIKPMGYLEFMGLQKDAIAIITDSGGIQEESTFLGVPCMTVRNNTERPITVEKGTNKLVGTNYSKIPSILIDIIEKNKRSAIPELWDGNASQRIADILVKKMY